MLRKYFNIIFFILIIFFVVDNSDSKKYINKQSENSGRVLGIFEKVDDKKEFFENKLKLSAYKPEYALNVDIIEGPNLKKDSVDFNVDAVAAIAIDFETNKVLFEKNPEKISSIASIVKLMTAVIFLENKVDMNKEIEIKKINTGGGLTNFYPGYKVKIKDLFYASLIASDNVATEYLVNATEKTTKEFVSMMNNKAKELNLLKTYFYDPVGLDSRNQSSAMDIAILSKIAFEKKEIVDAVIRQNYIFYTSQGKKIVLNNTNELLSHFPSSEIFFEGGKTGYTPAAGYCFVGKFSQRNNSVITVILGSQTKKSRFQETENLIKWIYNNYNWP